MGFAMRGHPAGKPTEVTEQGTLLASFPNLRHEPTCENTTPRGYNGGLLLRWPFCMFIAMDAYNNKDLSCS